MHFINNVLDPRMGFVSLILLIIYIII
jgi:hypothetical protein